MGVLRLFLAISVIVSHGGALFGTTMLPGNIAVETFFIISGFYMSLVLSSKYQGVQSLGKFYSNRFLRLYPTYLLVLLTAWAWMLLLWLKSGRLPGYWLKDYAQMDLLPKLGLIVSNWTMLGSDLRCLFHFSATKGFLFFHDSGIGVAADGARWAGSYGTIVASWSIGLEIWFYLLIPWLARLRTPTLVGIGLLSALCKASMEASGLLSYFFFPAQLGFFLIGVLAERFGRDLPCSRTCRGWGWAACAAMVAWIIGFPFMELPGNHWFFYAMVGGLLPLIFAASKNSQWDRWLGNLSYPAYLCHILVMEVFRLLFKEAYSMTLTLLGSLLVSALLVVFLEAPIDRWRQRRLRTTG